MESLGDGREAVTHFRIEERFRGLTLLRVQLETGRTHQIRVHLAHSGHVIVGDPKYGDFALNKALARKTGFDRMFLHAGQLRFTHPASGEVIELQAPLPAECEALIQKLALPTAP